MHLLTINIPQELLSEAKARLEASIPLVKLPPWPHPAVTAAPSAAAFLVHRFGKALRLLRNIAAFDSLLPRSTLTAMAFERIIQQQVSQSLIPPPPLFLQFLTQSSSPNWVWQGFTESSL